MIAIMHSIYSQSVHALALNAGLMDNDAERYCSVSKVMTIIMTSLVVHAFIRSNYSKHLMHALTKTLFRLQ